MELSQLNNHHTDAAAAPATTTTTTNIIKITTTSTAHTTAITSSHTTSTLATSRAPQQTSAGMDASNPGCNIVIAASKPAICDAPPTTNSPTNNNNNSLDSIEQKTPQQQHLKQSLLHPLKIHDSSKHSYEGAHKQSTQQDNAILAPKTPCVDPQSERELTQAVKIKRCKHGRIIIKDSSKKKSSSSINHPQRSSDNNESLPSPVIGVSVNTNETEPIRPPLKEPPKADSKSISNEKPVQECERLVDQILAQPSPSSDKQPVPPPSDLTGTSSNRLLPEQPSANINSKNNNNQDKSNKSTSERRHSRRHKESKRRRRHDKASTRESPRRCSIIRDKSHSQSPSHRKSPRRYRSTSSRERSRERRRQSSYRRRRSRSPYRSSRNYSKSDARKNIKLRSPRRHLSPISPPPRHYHEHLSSSRRRSPLRRHSRSSGSKSMSTSRSRSRSRSSSRSRSRSRTRTRVPTSARSNIINNDSAPKKDVPRESLDARIGNLFNHSSVMKEDSLLKKTPEPIVLPDSPSVSSTIQKNPNKPSAKNDYYDSASNSPPSDIYDPEGPISPLSSEPSPSGSLVKRPASNKKAYVPEKDVIPSSAVSLNQHEKYLQKKTRQERIVEEVKMALKPFYQRRAITKEQYKDVSRRAVPKICHSKNGEINPVKIRSLIHAYVKKLTHHK